MADGKTGIGIAYFVVVQNRGGRGYVDEPLLLKGDCHDVSFECGRRRGKEAEWDIRVIEICPEPLCWREAMRGEGWILISPSRSVFA